MRTILDLVAVFTASAAHFVSGFTLVGIGRLYIRVFSESEMELPMISKASAGYTATVVPIMIGVVLGLATLAGLGMVLRSEKTRWLLPFLLTLSFVILILHILFVWIGATLPLLRISSTMSE